MSEQSARPESARRILRCLACNGKIPIETEGAMANCPVCGLAVVTAPGMTGFHPMAVPRTDQNTCWAALVKERELPVAPRATELRSARLLLVPYWRHVDEAKRSVERKGLVLSAANLTPIGLPSMTRDRQDAKGLTVEAITRTGDGMGRLAAGAAPPVATVVDVMFGPEGGQFPGAGADWRLVYYPVWSFHYAVYSKEHFHMVDAITATPIGPARRLSWPMIVAMPLVLMLLLYTAGAPFIGSAAAAPAWLAALAAMRLTIRSQRA